MSAVPPVALVVVLAALVLAALLAVALRGRRKGWDAVDDGGPSELLPAAPPRARQPGAPPPPRSVLERLAEGLTRTRGQVVERLDALFGARKVVDEELWRQLEELLITSDVGVRATHRLLDTMRARAEKEELKDPGRLRTILRSEVQKALSSRARKLPDPTGDGPLVIMVVGVNGAGKTTTIGKLAARHVRAGRKVLVAAGDTFRAAAIEQVVVWAKRAGAEIVRGEPGSDPASVAHDAVTAAVSRGADVVICDTAGRLHTKSDLMAELVKVKRVLGRVLPGAPHAILLVLDSTNGQNAIAQAREFDAAVGVTGIALTKLDGTARGGVIIGIADELEIPVMLIGIGEGMDDLRDFEPEDFVAALFDGGVQALGRGSNSAAEAARDVERGIRADDPDESVAGQG